MKKRKFIRGLLISLTVLLLITIFSYVKEVYFKVFISLFLINFALLFYFKFKNLIKKETNKSKKENLIRKILNLLIVYGIPLLVIGYVIYMNWLPFGFEKTYNIDVGTIGDTNTNKDIYLEKNSYMSDPLEDKYGESYREVNGPILLVISPKEVLKNSEIEIEIDGEDTYIVPQIENMNNTYWEEELNIDFSKGIPNFLEGNAEYDSKKGCVYFNGESRLTYPNTKDKFEDGPLTMYISWIPENNNKNFQEIMGHYNWEIYQNKDSISFRIGKMIGDKKDFIILDYPIKDDDFYKKTNNALIIYNPDKKYISIFLEHDSVAMKSINGKIDNNYNRDTDLSWGLSLHGSSNNFVGCIKDTRIIKNDISQVLKKVVYQGDIKKIVVPIMSNGGKLFSINVNIKNEV